MRVLCVAEKPSISKAITGILSGGQYQTRQTSVGYIKNYDFDYPQTRSFYTVTCVTGHLTGSDFEEAKRKWHSCDPIELFDAQVEVFVPKDSKPIEKNLKSEARGADMLMIWTDCDREGEHIGSEIARVCRQSNPRIQVKRARFSAIIAQQIHNAAQHPVELDQRQADAVEARIISDLKIGSAFTRQLTMGLQRNIAKLAEQRNVISYGPCQFPTLGFVVQRYNTVRMFRPETFWYIYLNLIRNGEETKFNWRRQHIFDEDVVRALYAETREDPTARVTKVVKKPTKKWKPLPLTTVELQKAGSRLLKLAPKKVLDIAEKLYQQGLLSYPRTETDQFDPQFNFMTLIDKQKGDPNWGQFATNLSQGGFSVPRRGKKDDKAHPPIHPTNYGGAQLSGDDKRVYEYITRRFLACCSKDAEGWQTTVEVMCGGEEFSAIGLVVTERNYLEVYPYDKWVGHSVPDFQEGEEFQPTTCQVREGETTKPNYLTEADLVTLMDKNGIGTDATIAQHIQTIIDREYVIARNEGSTKYLVPSVLGIGLIEGYNRLGFDVSFAKPQLRRQTERQMVQVCEGTLTKDDMLASCLDQYKELFTIARARFPTVVRTVEDYLNGIAQAEQNAANPPPPPRRGGGRGPGGGGGGGGNDNNDDDMDFGGGGDGGTGGASATTTRGRGRGRGRGATRGTTTTARRGRGSAPAAPTIQRIPPPAPTPVVIPPPPPPTRLPAAQPPSATVGGGIAELDGWIPTPADLEGWDDDDEPDSWLNPSASPPPPPQTFSGASSATSSSTTFASSSTSWATSSASTSYTPPTKPPDHDVRCKCTPMRYARRRQVTGASANKGKWYLECDNDSSPCGFWEWDRGDSKPKTVIPAKREFSAIQESDPDGRPCKCPDRPMGVMRTVQKEGANKGKKFWVCQKREGEGRCDFFEWDDEPPRENGGGKSTWNDSSRAAGSGGGTASKDVCYKCQQPGHWANQCPGGGGNSTNKRTKSAATSGGYSSGRGGSRSKSYSGGGGGTSGACLNCGQEGHWASSCPDKAGSSKTSYAPRGTSKRGRGASTGTRGAKRGKAAVKKSSFAAADDY